MTVLSVPAYILYPSKACSNISFPMSLYTCSWLAKFGSSGCVCMRNTRSIAYSITQSNSLGTNGREEIAHNYSEVSLWVTLHYMTVQGERKGVLVREVSAFQGCF